MDQAIKLSIEDILNIEELSRVRVLTAGHRLDKKINKINIIVDPNIKIWINQEDFLLSTSFFYKSMDASQQIEFIKLLIGEGVSCLGIKFSPHFENLFPEVIAYAEDRDFVILDIDYSISFTDIISAIYEKLFSRQMSVINGISRVHDRAMELLLEGGTILDIVSTLSSESHSVIFVTDYYYDKFYHQSDENSEEFENIVKEFMKRKSNRDIGKGFVQQVNLGEAVFERFVFPIKVKNEVYGHILAFLKNNEFLQSNMQLVESVSTVMSLYFYNQISLEEMEIGYRSEFLENLFSKDQDRIHKALDNAIFFNMNPKSAFQVVQFSTREDSVEAEEILKDLYKIKSFVSHMNFSFVLAVVNNRINLLYEYSEKSESDLKQWLPEKGDAHQMVFGRRVSGLKEVHKSYEDCLKITAYPQRFKGQPVVKYEALGIDRILIHETLKEDIEIFYQENLMPLVTYDQKKGTNLVETLEAYFVTNGNLRKMSEILFTHYNTILYRMERIENITGMKLGDEAHRFNLQISLRIFKLLRD